MNPLCRWFGHRWVPDPDGFGDYLEECRRWLCFAWRPRPRRNEPAAGPKETSKP